MPKALLIALPVVLLLVLGVVFFTRNLNSDATTPPAPPPASVMGTPMAVPAPAPASPPVSLAGGQASTQSGSSTAKWLVGRWRAKSGDSYAFNDNGTGSRGSATGKVASDSFVWVMAQNQITLYLADKQEKLALSPGTDDSTLFLRGEDGKYVEFVRTKTNA